MPTYEEHATSIDMDSRRDFLLWVIVVILAWGLGCARSSENPSGHMTHLRGQLVDTSGRPVPQYPMRLEPISGSSDSRSAVTDYSGNFEFVDVPAGVYKVYPANRPPEIAQQVRVHGQPVEVIGQLNFGSAVEVELNAAAATVINDQARRTINPEAARTINPDAARTINPDAAKMINPAAARTINPDAARTLNPDAARVLNPDRARTLTPQQAKTLSVQQAKEPPRQ